MQKRTPPPPTKKSKSWSECKSKTQKPNRIKTIFNFAISESDPESDGDKRKCKCLRNEWGRERGKWEREEEVEILRE